MADRVLVTGASGFLGSHLCMHLTRSGHDVLGLTHSNRKSLPFFSLAVDICDVTATRMCVAGYHPSVVVHCAAFSKVLECERNPQMAERVNVLGTQNMVDAAASERSYTIFLSTDQVFDGASGFYAEVDEPAPSHVYGRSKLRAEHRVAALGNSLILRSNNIVGQSLGWGSSFTDELRNAARTGTPVDLFEDQYRSPIHIRSLVDLIHRCIVEKKTGVLHAGGPERLSRFETGMRFASVCGLPASLLRKTSRASHPQSRMLHYDGSFDITLLRSYWPDIADRRIDEGFTKDVEEEAVR